MQSGYLIKWKPDLSLSTENLSVVPTDTRTKLKLLTIFYKAPQIGQTPTPHFFSFAHLPRSSSPLGDSAAPLLRQSSPTPTPFPPAQDSEHHSCFGCLLKGVLAERHRGGKEAFIKHPLVPSGIWARSETNLCHFLLKICDSPCPILTQTLSSCYCCAHASLYYFYNSFYHSSLHSSIGLQVDCKSLEGKRLDLVLHYILRSKWINNSL